MSRRTATAAFITAAFITVAAMAVAAVATAAPPARVQSPAAIRGTGLARSAGLAAAQLPVMGYNTWYQYGRGATEANVLTLGLSRKTQVEQALSSLPRFSLRSEVSGVNGNHSECPG